MNILLEVKIEIIKIMENHRKGKQFEKQPEIKKKSVNFTVVPNNSSI